MSEPTRRLAGRLIGLGVTGSIAAYKAIELARRLVEEGAEVVAMLTPSATRFVAPLTFEALTRHAVDTDVLELLPDGRIGHIVVADAADAIVVAPATAHWLGAMAHGLAGDPVSAACLATKAPVVVAPAMDGDMYRHPATVANVARLREFGYRIVEPEVGPLASGQVGLGRLAELDRIVEAVVEAIGERPIRAPDPTLRPPLAAGPPRPEDLTGRRVVVTAGGTAEPIDPVRFIGNRSSGRMGIAVAEAALARGAEVTLIVGRIEVPPPEAAHVIQAETAADMAAAVYRAVLGPTAGATPDSTTEGPPLAPTSRAPAADVLVMAAAVADFRPARPAARKLPRSERLVLELEPTEDILAGLAERLADRPHRERPVVVAFAAETGDLGRAAAKLAAKGADFLVANDVLAPDAGFGVATNRVTIFAPDAPPEPWPLLPKREVAERILDRVVRLLDERSVQAGELAGAGRRDSSGNGGAHR
ncbi:MAG: peptidase ClpP [Chloroflexota bacterium]|nr:MAG: peptidase ClpP [Chloroflexota bacterium]